jgi:hypothetical protein
MDIGENLNVLNSMRNSGVQKDLVTLDTINEKI